MSEEVVGVKIKVGQEGFENIKELRKGLKDANDELLKAQTNFGNTSKEAIAAAKKVAEFKDTIQEARETADLFDPGKRFQAFSGALTAVAGGFSAVQGAIGLVGAESEQVEKTLLKVQSALALSQGLSTIRDSAKDFQRLGTVIKTQVVTAFSTLRGAIVATGIGALVVGLGLLVANFEKVKEAVLNAIPGLGRLISFVGGLVEKFTDLVGITSQAERNLEALENRTKRGNETIEARIKILSAQSGKEKEIYELSKQQGENELNFLREKLKTKNKLSDEELKKFRELKVNQQVLDAKEKKRLEDEAKEAKKKQDDKSKEAKDKIAKDAEERAAAEKEAAKKISQIRGEAEVLAIKDEFEAKRKAIENTLAAEIQAVNENEKIKASTKTALIKALNEKADAEIRVAVKQQLDQQAAESKEALKKQLDDERALRLADLQAKFEDLDKENARYTADFEADQERIAQQKEILAEQQTIELQNAENNELLKFEINKKYADKRKQLAEDEVTIERLKQEQKFQLQLKEYETLQQFGGLLTQLAGKNKALAIAGLVVEKAGAVGSILVNRQIGNAKAVAQLGPIAAAPFVTLNNISTGISIASVLASTIKSIQEMNSVGIPGGSVSAGGGGGLGASAAAPIAPAAPIQNTVTQLDQQSVNQIGNANNRAYVIESDVTNNQERIKRINRAARLT